MTKQYKLLFADDRDMWHDKIDDLAENYPSIKFIHVSTAEEALELIKKKKIDILITDDDFIMSGGCSNGCELTEDIRELEKDRKCKHIYIAMYADIISREDAINAGADLIVHKGDNYLRYAINKALSAIKNK